MKTSSRLLRRDSSLSLMWSSTAGHLTRTLMANHGRVIQAIQLLLFVSRIPWYAPRRTGSGAARLARSVRDAEVGGSNPLSPTD